MAISIIQAPALVSLSQSPMAFTVLSDTDLANPGFQYVCDLFIWSGALAASGSAVYQLVKYPNLSQAGIFEVSRIVNSTMTALLENTPSNVKYVKGDFYYRYLSGSVYVTGSHIVSSEYKALDGYAIFQEQIGEPIYNKTPHWPLMTDGPVTQSAFLDNYGTSGVYVGNAGATQPTKVRYTNNLNVSGDYTISGSTITTGQIAQYPIGPSEAGFPLAKIGLEWYTVQAYSGSVALGSPIRYEIDCIQKYPNVRIKWKNRYGQFDYFNFYMVNRQSFQTEKRTYQPQLGSWNSTALSYNQYDTAIQNYIVDSKQAISVNSYWIPETYNNIIKEMLVSDEMYWVYNEAEGDVRPITIVTQNIVFKTGVVDKLIQYQFDFNYGQGYKLII